MSGLVAVALGMGCASGELDEPRTAAASQELLGCDVFMCGSNSPQIAEFGFWDLNLPPSLGTPGLPNNKGLQVYGFVQGGYLYLPRVYGGRLTATRTQTVAPYDTITLSGAALVNGWFYLRNDTRVFKVQVTEVGLVESWAQPVLTRGHVYLESYKLDWSELVNGSFGDGRNVCKNPPSRDNPDALSMTGTYAFHTLLFEGDRIDAEHKLDTGVDNSWFNLGCAGSALAKMALTGHTQGAQDANTFLTSLPERQTMLKLLTADYCGDGKPFTVAGQPLNWRDDRGTMKLAALLVSPPQPLVLESRWTPQGPACLDKPRVDAHWTQLGATVFGADVYDQVAAWCPAQMPPPCADSSFETDGYHLLTATVPYQP